MLFGFVCRSVVRCVLLFVDCCCSYLSLVVAVAVVVVVVFRLRGHRVVCSLLFGVVVFVACCPLLLAVSCLSLAYCCQASRVVVFVMFVIAALCSNGVVCCL